MNGMNWNVKCSGDKNCLNVPVVSRNGKPPVCLDHSKTGIVYPKAYKITDYFVKKLAI